MHNNLIIPTIEEEADEEEANALSIEDNGHDFKADRNDTVIEDFHILNDLDGDEKMGLNDKIESMIVKKDILWQCKECGKVAKTRSHVKSHVETHIKGMPPVICGVCGKYYKSRSVLSAHWRQYHKNVANTTI